MNLRVLLQVLVVFAVVFVGNVRASEDGSKQTLDQTLNQAFTVAGAKTHGAFVMAGTFLANDVYVCAQGNIAGQAVLETAGYALGASNADFSKINYKEAGEHFFINYGIRKAGTELSKRGYSFDVAVKACDQLPVGVKDVVSPVVTNVVQVATHPETLTIATLYVVNNVVIPYLENNKK
jgi:hypothetical protein